MATEQATFTATQLNLRAIPLDAPENQGREVGSRVVWRWDCPGDHLYERDTIATEKEPALSEAAICADPYCHYCRKEQGRL